MSLATVLKAFFRSGPRLPRHGGDDLAGEVRDAMGPLAGGDAGGRVTGGAGHRFLEDRERD
jgi:hypothetical protein